MSFQEIQQRFGDRGGDGVRALLADLYPAAKLRCLLLAYAHAIRHQIERDSESARPSAALATRFLAGLELAAFPRLDRLMRDRALLRRRFDFELPTARGFAVADLPELGTVALLSMQPDGYLRADATAALARDPGPRAAALLALRLNDFVEVVRTHAAQALLRRGGAGLLEALAIFARQDGTARASKTPARASIAAKVSDEDLRAGLDHTDLDVRRACYRSLLGRVTGEETLDVLGQMLGEREAQLRREAAARVLNKLCPEAVRAALLPRLEVDRAPEIRRALVRHWARADAPESNEVLLRATFDTDSTVRFLARQGLAKRGGAMDLRARALRCLTSESPRELVGALSVLADLGRREDVRLVRAFATRPGRVGREASRTLEVLEQL